jgi:galactoside O-acetyltransferase
MNKYLTKSQLKKIGFKKIGKNCKISKSISTYNLIGSLGDNVRIDNDVQLKGKINLKSNVHIARGCTLSGGTYGIFIDELAALANYVQIYSFSDDYYLPSIAVATLDNKMRKKFSKVYEKKIIIGKCCIVGTFSVLLPGTILGNFSSIGALTIVNKKINEGFFYQSKSREKLKKRNVKFFKKLYKEYKKLNENT